MTFYLENTCKFQSKYSLEQPTLNRNGVVFSLSTIYSTTIYKIKAKYMTLTQDQHQSNYKFQKYITCNKCKWMISENQPSFNILGENRNLWIISV